MTSRVRVPAALARVRIPDSEGRQEIGQRSPKKPPAAIDITKTIVAKPGTRRSSPRLPAP